MLIFLYDELLRRITLFIFIYPNRKEELQMDVKKVKNKITPVVAAGNYDFLEKKASKEEKKKGEFTRVTRLALDEVDPS